MQVIVGKQDFASDRLPNRKYYGAIRGSNFTRGKVTNVDGSEALKIAGVKAVVSAVDVPDWNANVVYWGQPVAGVVAIDPYIAEYALTKVSPAPPCPASAPIPTPPSRPTWPAATWPPPWPPPKW